MAACVQSATAQCVRGVEPAADPAIAYRDRGGRCEGLFQQVIAASAKLRIVGLHRHEPAFQPGSGKPIVVAVRGSQPSSKLSLRIVSSRQRQYYRLDAIVGANGRYTWGRDIIDHPRVALSPYDVKALACEGPCEASEPKLFAVSIAEAGPQQSEGVTIWMRAALDVSKLFLTLERASDGKVFMNHEEVLGGRVLPAGKPLDVFVTLPGGAYRFHATVVPTGDTAVDEVRATLMTF
jgi:hypothetical protein